jgi:prepilin-type N-terminal cleavage/methylation domain-containing protein
MKRDAKGFTLIELLVVISIIGLLSSVVLASLSQARMKARDARRMSDIHEIDNAIQLYISENGHAPILYGSDDCMIDGGEGLGTCIARSGSGGSGAPNWTAFKNELAPYLSNIPLDPKNKVSRPDDPETYGAEDFFYAYIAPGSIQVGCPSCSGYDNNSYILHSAMENTGYRPGYTGDNFAEGNIIISRSSYRGVENTTVLLEGN